MPLFISVLYFHSLLHCDYSNRVNLSTVFVTHCVLNTFKNCQLSNYENNSLGTAVLNLSLLMFKIFERKRKNREV